MNMIKNSRRILVAILACALVFAMSVGALAANVVGGTSGTDTPTVTLSDSGNHAVFTLNRQNTDLFDNFKSVMPGDTLTQTVTVKTQAGNSSDYNIYLYAREAASSGDTALPKQSDFLKQLKITVTIEGRTVDLVAAGTGTAGVNLGQFAKSGATKDILVTLEVPIEMGNEFANANAQLDWFFYAQGIEGGSTGGGGGGGSTGGGGGGGGGNSGGSTGGGTVGGDVTLPLPPTVDITDPDVPLGNVDLGDTEEEEQVDITDPEVPLAALSPVSDIPQTGDENHMLLWGAVSVLSGGMLVFLLTGMKKKSNE